MKMAKDFTDVVFSRRRSRWPRVYALWASDEAAKRSAGRRRRLFIYFYALMFGGVLAVAVAADFALSLASDFVLSLAMGFDLFLTIPMAFYLAVIGYFFLYAHPRRPPPAPGPIFKMMVWWIAVLFAASLCLIVIVFLLPISYS